jgi:hypothetical protein
MSSATTTSAMMTEQLKAEWHTEFAHLVGDRKGLRPVLAFLPQWWPSRHVAFAYFNIVAIGPGLVAAPEPVRKYLLGHELGHIDRHHTGGQVLYWLGVLAAVLISRSLPPAFHLAPICLVLIAAVLWITRGETKREFEADDEAAARYGDYTVINGLTWMQSRRSAAAPKLNALRLERRRAHAQV